MANRTISFNLATDRRMTSTEAAYVAGFFDGEGSFSIMKTRRDENRAGFRFMPLMSAANTSLAGLQYVRGVCGNGRITSNYHARTPNHRPVYSLRFGANQIRQVLPQIRPYLIVKAQQADLLLAFLAVVRPGANLTARQVEAMEKFRHDIRSLNRRGQPADTPIDPVFLREPRPGYRHQGYPEPVN